MRTIVVILVLLESLASGAWAGEKEEAARLRQQGMKVYQGLGVPRDDALLERAANLEAARQGDAASQFRMGKILYVGQGVDRERQEAIARWARALAGASPAQKEWMQRTIDAL